MRSCRRLIFTAILGRQGGRAYRVSRVREFRRNELEDDGVPAQLSLEVRSRRDVSTGPDFGPLLISGSLPSSGGLTTLVSLAIGNDQED